MSAHPPTAPVAASAAALTDPGDLASAPRNAARVAHRLRVELIPERGEIIARDQLTLPEPRREVVLTLHRDLRPELASEGRLERIGTRGHLALYRVEQQRPSAEIALNYQGRIRHGLRERTEGMGRRRQQSIGTIGAEGVFLTGFTGWYPRLDDTMESFVLDVSLPAGWVAVSQGRGPFPETAGGRDGEAPDGDHRGPTAGRVAAPDAKPTLNGKAASNGQPERHPRAEATPSPISHWREPHPQDEIYLIAAPFQLYRQRVAGVDIQAWLRDADGELAQRYLDAAGHYLARYNALIGDYPYAKFALVENFWETGYGMPSFTLLGPRVLRLPFILHSSYPHEILHNWWGNGVFVDWDDGNWSEGLTAYLADHLNKALAGEGAGYRHDQLKAYADYVRDDSDIPLSAFRARHSQATQAIGYGKSLMVFHMLRQWLGDGHFIAGLRRLYVDNRFQRARWSDLQQAFELVSGRNLDHFFTAWVQRPGAVRLALDNVRASLADDGRYQVTGVVRQIQPEPPFPLRVPVVLHAIDGQPREHWLDFSGEREQAFAFTLDQPPLRLALDPLFDSFRWLEPGETPVSLSTLFGAPRGTIVLPARAAPELRDAYRQLAEDWQRGQTQWRIQQDSDLRELPSGPLWLLGWENRFLPSFSAGASDFSITPEQASVTIAGETHRDQIPVLTRRLETPSRQPRVLGWLAADQAAAIAGLARKIPHYGKYGYLLFAGTAPTNTLKGQWPVHDSPLIAWLDQRAGGDFSSAVVLRPITRRSLLSQLPNAPQAP